MGCNTLETQSGIETLLLLLRKPVAEVAVPWKPNAGLKHLLQID